MSRGETAREVMSGAGGIGAGLFKQSVGIPLALGGAGFKGDQVAKLYAIPENFLSNWSGTWGKTVPEGTHPIRDPFFADWHNYFSLVAHEGLPGGIAALAMLVGIGYGLYGYGQALVGYLRIKSASS